MPSTSSRHRPSLIVPSSTSLRTAHGIHRPVQMHQQPAAVRNIERSRLEVGFVHTSRSEVGVAQLRLLRELPARLDLFFIDVDASGAGALAGCPSCDIAQPAAELDEAASGSEAGTLQQLLCAPIVDLADDPEPVVIVFAWENVIVANGRHAAAYHTRTPPAGRVDRRGGLVVVFPRWSG